MLYSHLVVNMNVPMSSSNLEFNDRLEKSCQCQHAALYNFRTCQHKTYIVTPKTLHLGLNYMLQVVNVLAE